MKETQIGRRTPARNGRDSHLLLLALGILNLDEMGQHQLIIEFIFFLFFFLLLDSISRISTKSAHLPTLNSVQ